MYDFVDDPDVQRVIRGSTSKAASAQPCATVPPPWSTRRLSEGVTSSRARLSRRSRPTKRWPSDCRIRCRSCLRTSSRSGSANHVDAPNLEALEPPGVLGLSRSPGEPLLELREALPRDGDRVDLDDAHAEILVA
jgi:hypothetical protein